MYANTGKLSLRGLPRNSVVRIIDHPDMTSAVYRGCKQILRKNIHNIYNIYFKVYINVPIALCITVSLRKGQAEMTVVYLENFVTEKKKKN